MVDPNLRCIATGTVKSSQKTDMVYSFYADTSSIESPITVVYQNSGITLEGLVDRRTLESLTTGFAIPPEIKCKLIAQSRAYQ